jgi:hypothetical protein
VQNTARNAGTYASTESTSREHATTSQIGRPWANRLRNWPSPGSSVTTTTETTINAPSLISARLARFGERPLGSDSGGAASAEPAGADKRLDELCRRERIGLGPKIKAGIVLVVAP